MGVKCFLLEPTTKIERRLRRYVSSSSGVRCPGSDSPYSYHNASAFLDYVEAGGPQDIGLSPDAEAAKAFSGWPTKCNACDYQFQESDSWQVATDHVFTRADTGEEILLRDAPPGAMWNAYWFAEYGHEWVGPDGQTLTVVCPDGTQWNIDSRANNCDSPCENCKRSWATHYQETDPAKRCREYKDSRPHKCWIREGAPPMITVGKNGVTCSAGQGSIATGTYHGFLRNGEFDP